MKRGGHPSALREDTLQLTFFIVIFQRGIIQTEAFLKLLFRSKRLNSKNIALCEYFSKNICLESQKRFKMAIYRLDNVIILFLQLILLLLLLPIQLRIFLKCFEFSLWGINREILILRNYTPTFSISNSWESAFQRKKKNYTWGFYYMSRPIKTHYFDLRH